MRVADDGSDVALPGDAPSADTSCGDGQGDQFDRAAHCPARDRASLIQGILSVL